MSIVIRRHPPVTTSMGTFLARVVNLLRLPRGTRLGVVVGHRQIRADKRFPRKRLPKVHIVLGSQTVKQAADMLILPRLPSNMTNPRVVVYRPGERAPAPSNTLLRNAREWGDGLTEEEGAIFDAKVEAFDGELFPAYLGIEGDANVSKRVMMAAACTYFSNADEMHELIRQHQF